MLGHRREGYVHALGNVSFKVDRDTDSIGRHDDASGNVRNCDNPPTLMNLHFHCTIHGQVGTNIVLSGDHGVMNMLLVNNHRGTTQKGVGTCQQKSRLY